MTPEPGVRPGESKRIAGVLRRAIRLIEPDFPPIAPAKFIVRLFSTHHGFALALRREEGLWPQAPTDDLGNVVRGVLPIGPYMPLAAHRLAHVYTEWVLDRLTHNPSGGQPHPAWLYDGVAEWEADRRVASVPCEIHGAYPIPLSAISSSSDWWRVRGGPLGDLEYCEARTGAARAIARDGGWTRVRALLAARPRWGEFAREVCARGACG